MRITVGVVFMGTGWTKLQNLPAITRNFTALGIPAPEILTPFVSGVEFVGGILLLLGLLTRFAAVPLMIVMVVAIIAAKARRHRFARDAPRLRGSLLLRDVRLAGDRRTGPGVARSLILKASGRDPAQHGS